MFVLLFLDLPRELLLINSLACKVCMYSYSIKHMSLKVGITAALMALVYILYPLPPYCFIITFFFLASYATSIFHRDICYV
jgi:TRAP-type C4-dicarboxylate transport system permease small subunit